MAGKNQSKEFSLKSVESSTSNVYNNHFISGRSSKLCGACNPNWASCFGLQSRARHFEPGGRGGGKAGRGNGSLI